MLYHCVNMSISEMVPQQREILEKLDDLSMMSKTLIGVATIANEPRTDADTRARAAELVDQHIATITEKLRLYEMAVDGWMKVADFPGCQDLRELNAVCNERIAEIKSNLGRSKTVQL